MATPIYNIIFQVVRSAPTVTPTAPQRAGVYGDDKMAKIIFRFSETVSEMTNHKFRIEITDGGGAYDVTELLPLSGKDVAYIIPAAWTAAGTATVRLVEVEVGADGSETAVLHYPPVYLSFADREDGTAMGEMLPRWQAIMTDVENTVNDASQAADRANDAAVRVENASQVLDDAEQTAAQALADAKEAQERANTTTGVYVGSGDMPSGYNVQIDPTGESVVMADHIIEQGTSGIWTYRKWASGIAEAWCMSNEKTIPATNENGESNWTKQGEVYVSCDLMEDLPTNVFKDGSRIYSFVQIREHGAYVVNGSNAVTSEGTTVYNRVYWKVFRHWTDSNTYSLWFNVELKGSWK